MVFESVDALPAARPLPFVIVSVPTEPHVAILAELAAAGTEVLVEKTLAATGDEACGIVRICEAGRVDGPAGHVER